MKVLFLDVDGVITVADGTGRLDEDKLEQLNRVVQQTGCQICISSAGGGVGRGSGRFGRAAGGDFLVWGADC